MMALCCRPLYSYPLCNEHKPQIEQILNNRENDSVMQEYRILEYSPRYPENNRMYLNCCHDVIFKLQSIECVKSLSPNFKQKIEEEPVEIEMQQTQSVNGQSHSNGEGIPLNQEPSIVPCRECIKGKIIIPPTSFKS